MGHSCRVPQVIARLSDASLIETFQLLDLCIGPASTLSILWGKLIFAITDHKDCHEELSNAFSASRRMVLASDSDTAVALS